jgi:hypothetical protein
MRFLIHGAIRPEAVAALARKDHVCHQLPELLAAADGPPDAAQQPAILLPLLERRQWNLLTTDAGLTRSMVLKEAGFGGVIVLVLDDADAPQDQGQAIDRLFERYRRLTPGRVYTVTPRRVKIRQLPGAGTMGRRHA